MNAFSIRLCAVGNLVRTVAVGIFATFALASAASAHHGEANTYMKGQPVLWNGVVTFVSWDGAHVMYQIDVKNAEGVVESWQVLGGSPQRLAKRGIYKHTMHAGEAITVAGYLNADSRIVTPVYIVPNKSDSAQSDSAQSNSVLSSKLFVGYVASDATFPLPRIN